MSNIVTLQFGWHSHVPYVLDENNYYEDNRKRECVNWMLDSVEGFCAFYRIFKRVENFRSFISMSGQVVKQFDALAKMNEKTRDYLMSFDFSSKAVDEIQEKSISVLSNTKKYVENGRLELIGTGFNHAIMPYLNEADFLSEIEKIKLLYKEYFNVSTLHGYFPPESSVTKRDVALYAKAGIEYLVLEDPRYSNLEGDASYDGGDNFCRFPSLSHEPSLHFFHRSRSVSLLSWLSEGEHYLAEGDAEPKNRNDLLYIKKDESVDATIEEFKAVLSDSSGAFSHVTSPERYVELLLKKASQHMKEHATTRHSMMLFTDHEYLGGAQYIFPLLERAIEILASGNHSVNGGEPLEVEFSTLKPVFDEKLTNESCPTVAVEKGSWCSGLMLSDAYIKTQSDGVHVYSHGTTGHPFANWQSFAFHYDLLERRLNRLKGLVDNKVLSDGLIDIESKMSVAITSCFYGWFPPVYRMIPAFTLWSSLHFALQNCEELLGLESVQDSIAWDDKSLVTIRNRIQQLKLSRVNDFSDKILFVEKKIFDAENLFRAGFQKDYAKAYQYLVDGAIALDGVFEAVDKSGQLFQEPNNPWDLWVRESVDGAYI